MDQFTGYDPTIENRDEIANTATPMDFDYRDFAAPAEIDPRKFIRHDDQGNMGSCGGHGNTNTGEYIWALAFGGFSDDRQFSRLFSYLEAQRLDNLLGADRGSTISSGLKVSKEIGYLLETELPYKTPYPTNARSLVTDAMRAGAEMFKIRSHTWIESYDDLFKYLASGCGACFAGTAWNQSFHADTGVLESVGFTNRDGGHAYCLAGYSSRKDRRGRNYIWRKNSHFNDNWTEVSPVVFDALFKHQYTSIVGMSDLTIPGHRRIKWLEKKVLEG